MGDRKEAVFLTAKEWPDVMTLEQVAEYLQVGIHTVYRLRDSGKLKAAKVGRIWRVRKADVDAYLEASIKSSKEGE